MNQKSPDLFSRTLVHKALKSWHNLPKLGEHPLAHLEIVKNRHQAVGRADTPTDWGLTLRSILREAIEELRVGPGDPDYSDRRWRPYIILTNEFIGEQSPDYLAAQLKQPDQIGISQRAYQYARAKAIDRFASVLSQWTEDARNMLIVEANRVPFLAPSKPTHRLIGRSDLLRKLKDRLFGGGVVALCALNGLPGIGKTALSVELAHDPEVMAHFPDGVLWAGLGREPDLLAHLGTWAEAMGFTSDELARRTTIRDRQELLRTAIGQRRMLLVVDDAWQSEDALAFQIGGVNCAHLVTTRQPSIAMDFAADGLTLVTELEPPDGLALLKALASDAVAAEPDAAQALVDMVSGLPLALILMGRFLCKEVYGGQPRRLQRALSRLREIRERLQLAQPQVPPGHFPALPAGTPVSLWAAIATSDEALSQGARHALYALSAFLPKPNTFAEAAAIAVADQPAESLDELIDSGLLESGGSGRYTLHQVINDYATIKLADGGAHERLVTYFVEYVKAHRREYNVLEIDRKNVLAALDLACRRRLHAALIQGANAFDDFLAARGLYERARKLLRQAEEAARFLGDPKHLATTLRNLGRAERNLGNVVAARDIYLEALQVSKDAPDEDMQATYADLNLSLGTTYLDQGELNAAEQHFLRGLVVADKVGERELVLKLQANLGSVARRRGYLSQAEKCFEKALAEAYLIDDPEHISNQLLSLGAIASDRGDYGLARQRYRDGLVLARKLGYRELECFLRLNLGEVACYLGDYTDAEENLGKAQSIADDIGHRFASCAVSERLGILALKRHQLCEAQRYLNDAMETARESGYREFISSSLLDLGVLARVSGEYGLAQDHFKESLTLARGMGNRRLISACLCEWGELYLLQDKPELASARFREAREIAQQWGIEELVADALYGLSRVESAQGHTVEAERLGQESLKLFVSLSHFKASEVREWLASLSLSQTQE